MADSSDVNLPKSMVSPASLSEDCMVVSASKYSTPDQASSSFEDNSFNVCEVNVTPDLLNRSFNITFKLLSPAASSGPFCRICHEGDNYEDLVSLCNCTGTVGLVHLTCMEKWLNTRQSGHDKCEICNYSFGTIRSPKSIVEWYRSDQGAISTRYSILGDLACFSFITPLAAVSAFLCYEGAKRHIKWNNSMEAGTLMALATFLITIYIVWNALTIRHHLKNYFMWRSVNQKVRLISYRRRSTGFENAAVNQRAAVSSTAPSGVNENFSSESASRNQQAYPPSESDDVNGRTSNLCSTVA